MFAVFFVCDSIAQSLPESSSVHRPPNLSLPLGICCSPRRQLAPTVGLVVALAGLISDGIFFINSGTRRRHHPRAPASSSPTLASPTKSEGCSIFAVPLACPAALHQHCRRARRPRRLQAATSGAARRSRLCAPAPRPSGQTLHPSLPRLASYRARAWAWTAAPG